MPFNCTGMWLRKNVRVVSHHVALVDESLPACCFHNLLKLATSQSRGWDAAPIASRLLVKPGVAALCSAQQPTARGRTQMASSHMSRRTMLKGATAAGALAATSRDMFAQGARRPAPLPPRREF